MPAALNLAACLVLGAATAAATRQTLRDRDWLWSWPLWLVLAFQALVVTPASTFLYRVYPHWSMSYWFDPQLFPAVGQWHGAISAAIACLNVLATVGGFGLVAWGTARRLAPLAWSPFAIGATTWLALTISSGDRIIHVGDYDSYWRGDSAFLFASPAGWVGLLVYGGGLGFLWWLYTRGQQRIPAVF